MQKFCFLWRFLKDEPKARDKKKKKPLYVTLMYIKRSFSVTIKLIMIQEMYYEQGKG